MKRTYLLIAMAVVGVAAAFLLPRARLEAPPVPSPAPRVTPPPPPVTPAPGAGSLTLRARPARHAFLAGGDDVDVVYEVEAVRSPDGQRAPVDFALVLDRSGSMTGEPLQKAKAAAKALVRKLTARDRLALVHFGSDARLAFAATLMTASAQEQAMRAIDQIDADGGTNLSEALLVAERALDEAGRREGVVRRVALLSDGQANEGQLGPQLLGLAQRLGREGLRLSALGLGLDFDEDTMLALADQGGGQYRYLRDGDEVASALALELQQASQTAATAILLRLEPSAGEITEVVGYPVERQGGVVTLALSDLSAGELRRVVVRLHTFRTDLGLHGLVEGRLTYDDVLAGHKPSGAAAAASAAATTDPVKVAASYDHDAAKAGLRARFGGTMLKAAGLYDRDDVAGATRTLDTVLDGIRREAAAIGDGAFADELSARREEAVEGMRAAPSATAGGRGLSKSLKSFGSDTARH